MNPTDPLAELRGLSLPSAPLFDWWPLSLGWWMILILLVVAAYLLARFIKRKTADSWYKQALSELESIRHLNNSGDIGEQELLVRCSALCRRVAMAVEGREAIAGLTGMAWLKKLDDLSMSQEFTVGSGALLGNRLWQKQNDADMKMHTEILNTISQLIENSKPGRRPSRRAL